MHEVRFCNDAVFQQVDLQTAGHDITRHQRTTAELSQEVPNNCTMLQQ